MDLTTSGSGWKVLRNFGLLLALTAAGCASIRSTQSRASLPAEATRLVNQFHGNYEERRAASQSLIQLGTPALPALVAATRDPDPMVRWEAVNTLGYLRLPQAIPAVLERALEDPDVHARWRSIWSLSSINDGSAQNRLRKQLTTDDPQRRWNAAVALSVLGGKEAISILHEGLKHADAFTRWEAANGLGTTFNQTTPDRLIEAYRDSGTSVRQEIALSLGRIGTPQVMPGLTSALDDPEPEVRWRAAMALGWLRNLNAISILRARLANEKDVTVRENIESSLKRLIALPKNSPDSP